VFTMPNLEEEVRVRMHAKSQCNAYEQRSFMWQCFACLKRLERGRFTWPQAESASASLRSEELSALLSGLEVQAKANWYRR